MGCDIHAYAEVRKGNKWEKVGEVFPLDDWTANYRKKTHGDEPFDIRSYGLFGLLADVRNYLGAADAFFAAFAPKGLPDDVTREVRKKHREWESDAHSTSWLTLRELTSRDFDRIMVDKRIERQIGPNMFDGGCTATEREITSAMKTTYREFLPDIFFQHVDILKTLGAPDDVRVVFWFDN